MAKRKFWLLFLISGILVLVALFTPAWLYTTSDEIMDIWTWGGLLIIDNDGIEILMYDNLRYVIPGMLVALIQSIALIILIIMAFFIKKEKYNFLIIFSIISAVLLMISTLSFIFVVRLLDQYWYEVFIIGPGVIIPFISAAINIIITVFAVFAKKKLLSS